MIDLRSDVLQPTPAMRQAMAAAAMGDELFGADPTTRELEDMEIKHTAVWELSPSPR